MSNGVYKGELGDAINKLRDYFDIDGDKYSLNAFQSAVNPLNRGLQVSLSFELKEDIYNTENKPIERQLAEGLTDLFASNRVYLQATNALKVKVSDLQDKVAELEKYETFYNLYKDLK